VGDFLFAGSQGRSIAVASIGGLAKLVNGPSVLLLQLEGAGLMMLSKRTVVMSQDARLTKPTDG